MLTDYTSHVETEDFIRAFWITRNAETYLVCKGGEIFWAESVYDHTSRVVALYLSSRARYVLVTQTGEYLELTDRGGLSFSGKTITRANWVHYDKDSRLVLQDTSEYIALSGTILARQLTATHAEVITPTFERIQQTSRMKIFENHSLTKFGSEKTEKEKFENRVIQLCDADKPVRIYVGCGLTIRPDFLHIDMFLPTSNLVRSELIQDLFMFPVGDRWNIPDNSVDFILSEDFIEHLPQMIQVKFLAECYRVLKPEAINRVNTPCLLDSMKNFSKFKLGADGVYEREWKAWGHECLLTKEFLREISDMIGYKAIKYLSKNESVSPYHTGDLRPKGDRQGPDANIYADLIK
ncbi:class I SAM-dependent methyltransferase [Ningiella sp. W23]|uniref:class I SAM-dependent methyltransferase n=1 Tax=Ningiella sp. W23 TaxID=3023715 RepID=UPI0037578F6D